MMVPRRLSIAHPKPEVGLCGPSRDHHYTSWAVGERTGADRSRVHGLLGEINDGYERDEYRRCGARCSFAGVAAGGRLQAGRSPIKAPAGLLAILH